MQDFAERRQARQMQRQFGFDGVLLRDLVVARAAAASRSYMHGLYPPAAPGIIRWLHSVAASREALAPLGWEPDDSDQLSKVVNWERRIAIVPAAGNALTGLPFALTGKYPSTKWPKGERTAVAVARNEEPTLPGMGGHEEEQLAARPPLITWMLLQHATKEEVRSELSRPGAINARGFITRWSDRFILPPISNDGGPVDEPFEDGDDGIDITVEPR